MRIFADNETSRTMHTKRPFKIIGALVTLSLLALLVSQGYWLKGLYDSIRQQTEDRIMDALKTTDIGC
jgi:hypothetical protein